MPPDQQTFCAVCRHQTPGHEPWCPVLTGEPQMGMSGQAPYIPSERALLVAIHENLQVLKAELQELKKWLYEHTITR